VQINPFDISTFWSPGFQGAQISLVTIFLEITKPEVTIHKIPEDKMLVHFGFSMTRYFEEQGYSLCLDFAKREIPKEQASRHFGISAIGGSEDKGMGRLTREVLVPDKCPFQFESCPFNNKHTHKFNGKSLYHTSKTQATF
jgi:hypothetical protein